MATINKERVRETSLTTGTGDIVLAGRMRGSLAVSDVMANGDVADFVISYGDTFEAVTCTYVSATNKLVRGGVTISRHLVGTVDQNHVSFAAGVKTVILTYNSSRVGDLITLSQKAVRSDQVQSLTVGEQAQARANAPPFVSGTKMLFMQTSAPTGWTKDTSTHNDKALRIVTGTPSSGGSVDFSTCFSRTQSDSVTLAQVNLPAVNFTLSANVSETPHAHTVPIQIGTNALTPGGTSFNTPNTANTSTSSVSTGIGVTGTAASGGGNTSFTSGMDIRVKYADVIAATKD